MPAPPNHASLLAGRNRRALDEGAIRRAYNTFRGMDQNVPVRHEAGAQTRFRLDGNGDGEIVFGEDLYPGEGVADPNSNMGMPAAVAHELSHYHRWINGLAIDDVNARHLDEAMTSLDAIARYQKYLSDVEVRQLAADAAQRVRLHVQDQLQA